MCALRQLLVIFKAWRWPMHAFPVPLYQIAIVAKACNKPVYVAAESYKFARLYPLTQKVSLHLRLRVELLSL